MSGLRLTDAVKEEIVINRVTFISVRKLVRVRKRLGIPEPISHLRSRYSMVEFLNRPDQVVAVLRQTGRPHDIDSTVRRIVTEELFILAASQLGFKKRRYNSYPVIGGTTARRFAHLCINTNLSGGICSGRTAGKLHDLITDERWIAYNRNVFFKNLIETLEGRLKVEASWKQALRKVALLVGQSQSSSDVAHAFLLNMIAIEVLLVEEQDKQKDALPERVEAFIGWVGYWHTRAYEKRLREAYKKRCLYVHSGAFSEIQIKDLLFMDDILLNVLANILGHPAIFVSKRAVIEFSNKVSAEKILGLQRPGKSRVRPKTLLHISRQYSESDLAEI
ncbi:hypothetical protein [Synechococcus sp. GFB01]|uniref:hypothetical protein n=1 Tax=Synechococcus sp. GFB01 TaxID=1662190 RepID=UPI00128DDF1D|nr:hypothetical protein [Synechococcus sp. GFB01]